MTTLRPEWRATAQEELAAGKRARTEEVAALKEKLRELIERRKTKGDLNE